MEQTEHGGGEGSAIERRGDPKGGRCPRLISPERASDLARRLRKRTWSTLHKEDRSEDCSAFSSRRRIS